MFSTKDQTRRRLLKRLSPILRQQQSAPAAKTWQRLGLCRACCHDLTYTGTDMYYARINSLSFSHRQHHDLLHSGIPGTVTNHTLTYQSLTRKQSYYRCLGT